MTQEYEVGQYFTEAADPEVKGFVVIEATGSRYRIAEKWMRADAPDVWISYWVPAEKLNHRIQQGDCAPVATVSDQQFEAVCQKTDERALEAGGGL